MTTAEKYTRLGFTLLLGFWGFRFINDPEPMNSILHAIVLPIHETGHIVFAAFGEYMGFAGGSIFQIIFPVAFIWHFWRRGDRHAATVPLWFVGIAAIDLVPYVKDAHSGDLELIGGEHDWSYLLSEIGKVHLDQQIGDGFKVFGTLVILAAVILGVLWHNHTPEAK